MRVGCWNELARVVNVNETRRRATPRLERLLRVGFKARLVIEVAEGTEATVVLTRTHARSLGLTPAATVWLTPAAEPSRHRSRPGRLRLPALVSRRRQPNGRCERPNGNGGLLEPS